MCHLFINRYANIEMTDLEYFGYYGSIHGEI